MAGRYKITTEMSVKLVGTIYAANHDIELELTYDVDPGYAETQWQPGEAASISVQTAYLIERNGIEVTRHEAPTWLWRMIEGDDALEAEMLEAAWADEEAARDDHADMIREERMLEQRA